MFFRRSKLNSYVIYFLPKSFRSITVRSSGGTPEPSTTASGTPWQQPTGKPVFIGAGVVARWHSQVIVFRVRDINADHLEIFEIAIGQPERPFYSSKIAFSYKRIDLTGGKHKRYSVTLTYTIFIQILLKHKSSPPIAKVFKVMFDVLW